MENEYMICPITNAIMEDPVVAEDGHTYERSAITEWLKTKQISPITRATISNRLITNFSLRSIIDEKGNKLKNTTHGKRIVLVLDVSGSMDSPAKKNIYEPTFSRLDLIKHSVLVISNMLSHEHVLTVITFNHNSNVIISDTIMDLNGKEKVKMLINSLTAGGGTDIPSGLKVGINEGNGDIILLTDGENSTTIHPETIKNILLGYTGKVHTVGFGMSIDLDTKLLQNISNITNGFYCYCSDQSMVGSVFIHLIANICVNEPGEKFDEYDKFLETIIKINEHRRMCDVDFKSQVLMEEFYSDDPNKGQISKAIKNWDEWGRHYLPSLISAHKHMMVTNFKDASIQNYMSEKTKKFIEYGETVFTNIIPPVPSCNNHDGYIIPQSQFLMDSLLASGGCFGPDTVIGNKKIRDLKKGDVVNTMSGPSKVVCLVSFGYDYMIKVNDFYISGTHPIYVSNNWIFPRELYKNNEVYCAAYNLILEKHHNVLIGDVAAITLGHGMKGGIVEHDYLGTDKIIKDLSSFEGFDDGYVHINGIRRNVNGIYGIF